MNIGLFGSTVFSNTGDGGCQDGQGAVGESQAAVWMSSRADWKTEALLLFQPLKRQNVKQL